MYPALTMEAYRECCHYSSHSSPLSEMSTSEEQRCVRAQGNCLLAFSNTSLVMVVEIASSLINLFMFTMIHFTVCVFVYNLSRDAEHYEAAQSYASYPPYLHVHVLHCQVRVIHMCVCVCDKQCVSLYVNDKPFVCV